MAYGQIFMERNLSSAFCVQANVLSRGNVFFILSGMERLKPSPGNSLGRRTLITKAVGAALATTMRPARADDPSVRIGYLRWPDRRPIISFLDKPAPDEGLAGAKLAITDNNTTGQFINQQFDLTDALLRDGDDAVQILGNLAGQGVALMITDAPAALLLDLAAAAQRQGRNDLQYRSAG